MNMAATEWECWVFSRRASRREHDHAVAADALTLSRQVAGKLRRSGQAWGAAVDREDVAQEMLARALRPGADNDLMGFLDHLAAGHRGLCAAILRRRGLDYLGQVSRKRQKATVSGAGVPRHDGGTLPCGCGTPGVDGPATCEQHEHAEAAKRKALAAEDRERMQTRALDLTTPGPQDQRDERDTVRSLLAPLPPRDRWLVWLVYVGGYSHARAAQELGIPASTAGDRLRRSKRLLRQALAGSETLAA